MSIGRWIFAAVVVALVALVAVQSLQPRPRPATNVQTVVATRSSITRTVSGAGKIEPVHKVNVSANITGTLLSLDVAVGSKVVAGQPLGQIDTSLYKSQVQQQQAQVQSSLADVKRARANLEHLKREAVRLEQLRTSGVSSEAEVTQAAAMRDLAASELAAAEGRAAMSRASLSQANSSLGWATLKAPIDGTVLAVHHRVGERVRGSDFAEDVILVLGSLSEVDVRFEIGEYDVVYIRPGQVAQVEIDAFDGTTIPGVVIDSGRDAIVKNAGTENEVTTFPVWVSLANPPARTLSGMSAQVTISTETRENVVSVPIQAVTVRAVEGEAAAPATPETGKPQAGMKARRKLDKVVFVVENGVVHKRVVEVGLSSETHTEIVKGLKEGEVVVEGPYRTLARELEEGTKVNATPANAPDKK
jgi:HlyD family secretion protein